MFNFYHSFVHITFPADHQGRAIGHTAYFDIRRRPGHRRHTRRTDVCGGYFPKEQRCGEERHPLLAGQGLGGQLDIDDGHRRRQRQNALAKGPPFARHGGAATAAHAKKPWQHRQLQRADCGVRRPADDGPGGHETQPAGHRRRSPSARRARSMEQHVDAHCQWRSDPGAPAINRRSRLRAGAGRALGRDQFVQRPTQSAGQGPRGDAPAHLADKRSCARSDANTVMGD